MVHDLKAELLPNLTSDCWWLDIDFQNDFFLSRLSRNQRVCEV